jgi:IS5 family transposase
LARYLVFRRFVDLSLSESVPDHSTFWHFRNILAKEGLFEVLLDEINAQLVIQGLLIRAGKVSIIDASVIEAKQNRPKKDKNDNNTQNPEAAYNVKKTLKARLKRFMALKCTQMLMNMVL